VATPGSGYVSSARRQTLRAAMNSSDTIALANIAITVLAVVAAPNIALWVSGRLQRAEDERRQQLELLGVLVSLRHQPLSPENFKALNLIDMVFVDNTNVREAWSRYYTALSDTTLNAPPGHAMREEKRRELMMAIIDVLGMTGKISTSDLLRTYTPTTIVEIDALAMWERIKRRADLREEFIRRGIGFPDYTPPYYPPPPPPPPDASSR
jgi:hypothetical protein